MSQNPSISLPIALFEQSIVTNHMGTQLLVRDCPYCHGQHRHYTRNISAVNGELREADCGKGQYVLQERDNLQ